MDSPASESISGPARRSARHVGGPAPLSTSRIGDLDGVADGRPSGTDMSVSKAPIRRPCSTPMDTSARAIGGVARFFMNAPGRLDVQHQRAGALGDLLAHDGAGDQRHRLDGPGDVRSAYSLRSAGATPRWRPDHRADGPQLRRIPQWTAGPAAGMDSSCPGCRGVAETTTGQLRTRAASRDQGRQRQCDLSPSRRWRLSTVGRSTSSDSRSPESTMARPPRGLVESMPFNRIAWPARHLLVCDDAVGVRVDDPVDLPPVGPADPVGAEMSTH